MCSAPAAPVYFLSGWAAVAVAVALAEGQPRTPLRRLSHPAARDIVRWVPDPPGLRVPPSVEAYTIISRTEFAGFHYLRGQVNARQIVVPWWFLFTCLSLAPAHAARAWWRRTRSVPPGVCRECGYDLRATPERCPECGAARTTA
jgi:hypothetical protein